MTKVKIKIWGRQFNLPVEYECYEDESVTSHQKAAYDSFLENASEILDDCEAVKKYCMKYNPKDEREITNIFKYVVPARIYILQTRIKRSVVLMCHYKFDPEEGIGILFENEKLKKVGQQGRFL